ncbi:hypothetical protein CORC01_11634 [Colletotrichum orchidophilum]|uniref:Uncharacterized protein n=1 Tax=Colletotrichum orchidophilum TaxID=1209926 RepID=A0A1G4AV89_9PEZI|nr:uncharacterized protein CORC01_11634 [Colletotrichum orchidophilum]OHE93077.1 hypothetical protein CORC01_11634 [Colletotrichum orchidophilum]
MFWKSHWLVPTCIDVVEEDISVRIRSLPQHSLALKPMLATLFYAYFHHQRLKKMKLSILATIAAVAITSTEACAKYTNCWCVRNNFMYNGALSSNIPWDAYTSQACSGTGQDGYYGPNYQECYRYKKSPLAFIPSKAINNCDWTEVSLK